MPDLRSNPEDMPLEYGGRLCCLSCLKMATVDCRVPMPSSPFARCAEHLCDGSVENINEEEL